MLYSLKKSMSFFLATVFLMSCVQFSYAADGVSVSAGTVSGKPGDTVSVDLSITGNTGFTSFTLNLGYNAGSLTFDSASTSLAGVLEPTSENGQTQLKFTATDTTANITSNGAICTVKFKINSAAATGDVALSLSGSANNKDNTALVLGFTDGKVTVENAVYSVTVTSVGNGTATSYKDSYAAGETVNLTATPSGGFKLKSWSTESTGVTFGDAASEITTFTMPDHDVAINATFESQTTTYTVTINTNGYGTAVCDKTSYSVGDTVTISATPNENYSFNYWSTTGNADFDDEMDSETYFKMPAANVTITANFKAFDGYKVTVLIDGGGNATTDKDGYDEGDTVVILASPSTGYYFYGWSASSSEEVNFLNATYYRTTFIMPDHDVKIRALFAKSLNTATSSTIATTQTNATFMFSYDTMGGSTINPISVTGGYTAAKPADPTKNGYTFSGWYTDTTFTTPYDFNSSVYSNMAVYAKWTQVSEAFSDVKSSDWFYNPVKELYTKKIIGGIGNGLFMPKSNITRAQFCQILAKLSGSDLSVYTSTSFSDIKSTDWCVKSVAWAYEKGVVKGLGNGVFSPNAPISRQDMAVMISRFAQVIKNYTFPASSATSSLSPFADENQISDYAKSAVANMQQSKIISGTTGNKFNPKANASRAEACKMIYELIKLINI